MHRKKRTKKQISLSRLSSHQIMSILEKHRLDIRKYNVKKLGLFGSFAKDTAHSKSDIDFLVQLKEPTFDAYMNLRFLLEKMFHRKVDLVLEDALKKRMLYIKKEALYVKGL